jgi:hypothetical protein
MRWDQRGLKPNHHKPDRQADERVSHGKARKQPVTRLP